ncbi:MAG TPA: rhodanese-like domain-containing protein [Pyrinomonadaceae bacterium]|nr:rhodanese-like domain-containing protein [Pyrinomonadaceae bacterium]
MKKTIFLILVLVFTVSIFAACESVVTDVPAPVPSAVTDTSFNEISPAEARTAVENKDVQFIDVRSEAEYGSGHAPNALNFPLDTLANNLEKLDKSKPVYVICETGRRSQEGAKILHQAGFAQVFTIAGGTSAWMAAGLPVEKNSVDSKSNLEEKTENAMLAALADERRAVAEYEAVLEKFGDARPFSNIVNAEKRHKTHLLPLFKKYGVQAPENQFRKEKAEVPETLIEACKQGVEGEKANIAIYDNFLEFVKEADIREVFTYLRDASKNNHLPAFERCAEGRGKGMGSGRGKGF